MDKGSVMKITCRQLRRLIKEAIDVVNSETGEIIEFGPGGRIKNQMPDAAWPDLQRRLGITVIGDTASGDPEISSEDWYKLEAEFYGKQDTRLKKLVSSDSSSWDPYAGIAGDGDLSDSEARDLEGLVYDATTDALSDGGDESSSSDLEKKVDLFAKNIGKQVRGSGTGGATIEGPPLMDSDGRYSVPLSSPYGEPDYVSIENLEIINPQSAGEIMREQTVKITRKQLRRLIKEQLDEPMRIPRGGLPLNRPYSDDRLIANAISNRAYDLGKLDDINEVDPDALDFELPKWLMGRAQELGIDVDTMIRDIHAGEWDDILEDLLTGEEKSKLIDHWDPEGQEILDELETSVSQKSMDQVSARLKELWPKLSSDFQAEIIRMYASEYPVLTDLFKQSRSEFLQGHGIWG